MGWPDGRPGASLTPFHVRSYDFAEGRTHDGRKDCRLYVLGEFSRECLTMRVRRKPNSTEVVDALTDLFIPRGIPGYIRSENDP